MRSRLFTQLLSLTALLALSAPAEALEKDRFRLGIVSGQVGLLGDPGQGGANGIGFGVSVGYQIEDNLAAEVQYMGSSHSEVDHRDLSVGIEHYFSDYESSWPHISAGMSFINNKFKRTGTSGDAAAVFLGGGLGFELSRDPLVGPEFRFQKSFESKGMVEGRNITTVADSYTLLIRLIYSPATEN